MKYKIVSISSGSETMVLRLETTEEVKPKKEYNEVHKFIEQLKNSDKEIDKITASSLAGMVKYFESIQETENRQFKRHDEIAIDKTVFRELKLNVDDIIIIDIKKDSQILDKIKFICEFCLTHTDHGGTACVTCLDVNCSCPKCHPVKKQ